MHPTASIGEKIWLFLKLVWPMTITQFALLGGSFIAVFLTGQYGTIDLAGMSVGYNIWIAFYMGAMGTLLGITPIISQLLGARKTDHIATIVQQGLVIATAIGMALVVLGVLALNPFLQYLNLEPAAREVTVAYLKAFAIGLFPILWGCTLRNTIDSHGLTAYSMATVVFTFFLNIFFNYGLILGHFGMPALGGVGAGYAVAITIWVNCLIFALICHFHPKLKAYKMLSQWHGLEWTYIREQLAIGIPIGFSIFFEGSIFSIAGLLMVQFGTLVVAAHQAAISFTNIFYCFPLSISMAATIAVAYELGAKKYKEARQYAWIARITAILIAILLCSYSFTHMNEIAGLYTNDPEVFELILSFLSYAVFFAVIDAFGTPLQGILRAYKDVQIISTIALISYWGVGISLAYILTMVIPMGPYGVWIGLLSSVVVASILYTIRTWWIQRKLN